MNRMRTERTEQGTDLLYLNGVLIESPRYSVVSRFGLPDILILQVEVEQRSSRVLLEADWHEGGQHGHTGGFLGETVQ